MPTAGVANVLVCACVLQGVSPALAMIVNAALVIAIGSFAGAIDETLTHCVSTQRNWTNLLILVCEKNRKGSKDWKKGV